MIRTAASLVLASGMLAAVPAAGQTSAPAMPVVPGMARPGTPPQPEALRLTIDKSNAYVGLLNRTLRAQESISRYRSWVKSSKGPTGRERIVYGLYSLYDVRGEIAKAKAAMTAPPADAALDAAMGSYIAAYEVLAPIIGEAEAYYERKDYLVDKMEKGKAIHARFHPAAEAFLAERAKVETAMTGFRAALDKAELDDLEQREGRKTRWQARNVMVAARPTLDLLPSGARPVVDLPKFDAAVARYADAVTEFDTFVAANPGSLSAFESQPRSYLGKLREFRQKLGRAKGDARRAGAGHDLTWLVNDYNMMVSQSQMAIRFSR